MVNQQRDGRVAIVTGGGSGIGRASVLRFLSEGAKVIVADLNGEAAATTLKLAEQTGHGRDIRCHRCDVAQESEIESLVDFVEETFAHLIDMPGMREALDRLQGKLRDGS